VTPPSLLRWTWVFLGLHLAWLLVRYALGFPLWGDEGFVAVNLQVKTFAELYQPLEYGQVAPLLWWWLEKAAYDLFGGSVWALRLPALVAAIVTTWLMLRLFLRALPQPSALFAFAVFAVAYYPLRHGVELKPYAFDLLWAAAMLNLALDLFAPTAAANPSRARRQLLALMALSLIGVWGSMPSLFLSAALGLACVWHWRPKRAQGAKPPLPFALLLAWGFLLIADAAWMVEGFAKPHTEAAPWLPAMDMWTRTFPPLEQWWRIPDWWVTMHTGWLSAYPTGGPPPGSALNFLLIVIGVVSLWRAKQRFFLWVLLGPLLFNFAAAAIGRYPYGGSVRVSIYLAPAMCLLIGHGLSLCLDRLREGPRGKVSHAFLAILLVFGGAGLVRDMQQPYKGISDLRSQEYAAELAGLMEPGDQVTVWLAPSADGGLSLLDHGGSFARFRYALRESLPQQVPLHFRLAGDWPSPEAQADGGQSRHWIVLYEDDNQTLLPFPRFTRDAAWLGFRGDWTSLEYVRPRFVFDKTEAVELWRMTSKN